MINNVSLLGTFTLETTQSGTYNEGPPGVDDYIQSDGEVVLSGPAAAQQGTVSSGILSPATNVDSGALSACGAAEGGLVAFLAQRPMLLVHSG